MSIGLIFALTIGVILASVEVGHRLGRAARARSTTGDPESSGGAITASILGLVAFMMAFTFGIVANRYDNRKELVRNEANAIGTAYLRTDFLPEPDRSKTTALFREYLDTRIASVESFDLDQVQKALAESQLVQTQLWDLAVANARKDMNSDVAALYIESLNAVIDVHALRVSVGLQARVPAGLWLVLYVLVMLGMIGVGYEGAVTGSGTRPWATPILAFAFALVICLIASLDRPISRFITVSQQPLLDLRASIDGK